VNEDRTGFVAHASNPSFGTEAVVGRITCDRWRLLFQSPTLTLEIPLTRLQIAPNDAEGEEAGIFLTDSEKPGWSIYTVETQILQAGPLLQQGHTRHQIKNLRTQVDLRGRLKVTLIVLGSVVVVAVVATMLTGVMVRALVAKIPPKWEQDMGDAALAEYKKEETFIQDAKLLAKLDQAVGPLVSTLPKTASQYKFYLMQHPFPNAFALPGGHVIVTTGLLELAGRPEELAGVVAHEIAHVTQKHEFRKAISSYGPYLIFKLFASGGSGMLGMLGGTSQLLVSQSFSQEYELEADAVGWQTLVDAHIDPRGLAEMLTRLKAFQRGMGLDPGITAFSSHPAVEKRIRRLDDKWRKLKNKSGFIELRPVETPR
jgi:predicted Zn-dependent protease